MNILKNLTKNIKGYGLAYALLYISLVLYLIFTTLANMSVNGNSSIPSYSWERINRVNEKLSQRETLPPLPETTLTETDFGKEEPFR